MALSFVCLPVYDFGPDKGKTILLTTIAADAHTGRICDREQHFTSVFFGAVITEERIAPVPHAFHIDPFGCFTAFSAFKFHGKISDQQADAPSFPLPHRAAHDGDQAFCGAAEIILMYKFGAHRNTVQLRILSNLLIAGTMESAHVSAALKPDFS